MGHSTSTWGLSDQKTLSYMYSTGTINALSPRINQAFYFHLPDARTDKMEFVYLLDV